jgi:hypothetical protein
MKDRARIERALALLLVLISPPLLVGEAGTGSTMALQPMVLASCYISNGDSSSSTITLTVDGSVGYDIVGIGVGLGIVWDSGKPRWVVAGGLIGIYSDDLLIPIGTALGQEAEDYTHWFFPDHIVNIKSHTMVASNLGDPKQLGPHCYYYYMECYYHVEEIYWPGGFPTTTSYEGYYMIEANVMTAWE